MNEKRNRALKFIEMVLEDMWMEGRVVKSVLPNEEGDFMYVLAERAYEATDVPFETYEQHLTRISKLN